MFKTQHGEILFSCKVPRKIKLHLLPLKSRVTQARSFLKQWKMSEKRVGWGLNNLRTKPRKEGFLQVVAGACNCYCGNRLKKVSVLLQASCFSPLESWWTRASVFKPNQLKRYQLKIVNSDEESCRENNYWAFCEKLKKSIGVLLVSIAFFKIRLLRVF